MSDSSTVTIGARGVIEYASGTAGAMTMADEYPLIGTNAVVLHEAVVGQEALIAAGSVVTDATRIPPRTVAAGAPCTARKELSGASADWIGRAAEDYVGLARRYRRALTRDRHAEAAGEGPISG